MHLLTTTALLLPFALVACTDPAGAGASPPAPPIMPPDGDTGAAPRASRDGAATPQRAAMRDDGQPGGGAPGSPVPEPATLLLVGLGLAGIAVRRRRPQRS